MKREPNANDRVEWISQATGNTAAKTINNNNNNM